MEADLIIAGAVLQALGVIHAFGSLAATAEIQIIFGSLVVAFGAALLIAGALLIVYGAISKKTV